MEEAIVMTGKCEGRYYFSLDMDGMPPVSYSYEAGGPENFLDYVIRDFAERINRKGMSMNLRHMDGFAIVDNQLRTMGLMEDSQAFKSKLETEVARPRLERVRELTKTPLRGTRAVRGEEK